MKRVTRYSAVVWNAARTDVCCAVVWGIAALSLMLLALSAASSLAGCTTTSRNSVQGGRVEVARQHGYVAAPGAPSVTTRRTTTQADGSVTVEETMPVLLPQTTVTGTAVGASATATGDKAELKTDGSAPTLTLPEIGSASGGGFRTSGVASIAGSSALQWALWIVGGLVAGFGAWRLSRGHPKQGPTLMAAGVVLIVGGFYPLALLALIVLVGVGYVFWYMDAGKRDALLQRAKSLESLVAKQVQAATLAKVDGPLDATLNEITTVDEDVLLAEALARAEKARRT